MRMTASLSSAIAAIFSPSGVDARTRFVKLVTFLSPSSSPGRDS